MNNIHFKILLFSILICSCKVSIPIDNSIKKVSGHLYVLEDGKAEPLIGYNLYQYGSFGSNTAITEFEGEYELELENDTMLLVVSGFYEPVIFEIDSVNQITVLNSPKLTKEVKNYGDAYYNRLSSKPK